MQKELRERDLTIQGKDGEIMEQRGRIKTLEDEIDRLKREAAAGGAASSELEKLLAESNQKLNDALRKIQELENTIENNERKYQGEYKRLNTEIERLNNILKATAGDM